MSNALKKTAALLLAVMAVFSETAFPVLALEADTMSFVGIRKNRTAKILDDFKDRQSELFFDNTPFMLGEESGLFDAQARTSALKKIEERLANTRKQYQERKKALQAEKVSLRNLVKRLDESISESQELVKNTQLEIVKGARDIAELEVKIADVKKKIEENRKTILEYLAYLYTRGDLVYSEEQDVDLVKSVILNDGDFSEIITDIHYKSLLESAGQNFIEIRRGLLKQYYVDSEALKAEKVKNLRYRTALRERRKQLEAQREYKERLLRITQGREALFNRYIMDKSNREKALRERIDSVQSDSEMLFNEFSKRYGCNVESSSDKASETVVASAISSSGGVASEGSGSEIPQSVEDVLKSDAPISSKCREVRAFFEAEKALKDSTFLDETGETNPFLWPVDPRYVSAYFHDQEYYDSVGSEHEAIDIPAAQGTDIVAPADAYVYFVNPPVEGGYGYVALKHTNGFLTVYGHVSEVLAKRFQFVKAGEVFAKSGGAPGTPGAGVMTSGAHLHFEIHRNRESVDPLRYLDLTRIRYETLDAKYSYKYVQDLRTRYGSRANTKGITTFRVVGDTEEDRQKNLLSTYAVGDFKNWDIWTEEGMEGRIDPSFIMCVGLAETGLGKNLKTPYNVGNVGNTDSGGTYDFLNAREGIYWMVKTLNNRYLSKYEGIQDLSRWGNKDGAIYASSSKHWHTNVVRCLSALKGRFIEDDYRFRLSPEEADLPLSEISDSNAASGATVATSAPLAE